MSWQQLIVNWQHKLEDLSHSFYQGEAKREPHNNIRVPVTRMRHKKKVHKEYVLTFLNSLKRHALECFGLTKVVEALHY